MSDNKIFIGCIPHHITEAMVKEKVEEHGTVKDFFYMQDGVGTDRGWCFVTYDDMTEAAVAVAMINGSEDLFPGSVRPVHAKFANEKLTSITDTVFEAPTKAVTPWTEHQTDEGKSYYHNAVTGETVWERPKEMDSFNILAATTGALAITNAGAGGGTAVGPMGANIFVYYLPLNWTDEDLRAHFCAFGQMISGKIHTDTVTGVSKGFGFVSYASPQSATLAIKGMNGFDTKQGKWLKVTIRKGEESYNPDAVAAQAAAVSRPNPNSGLVGIQATVGHTLMLPASMGGTAKAPAPASPAKPLALSNMPHSV